MIMTEGGFALCVVTEYYQKETEAVVVEAFHLVATEIVIIDIENAKKK